jgi:hypothetical protein
MNLNGTRKDQGVGYQTVSTQRGPESGRQVGPASLGEAGRPAPVAILCDLFAQVQARYVLLQGSCLGDFAKFSSRLAWFKPPGLIFSWNCCALDKT